MSENALKPYGICDVTLFSKSALFLLLPTMNRLKIRPFTKVFINYLELDAILCLGVAQVGGGGGDFTFGHDFSRQSKNVLLIGIIRHLHNYIIISQLKKTSDVQCPAAQKLVFFRDKILYNFIPVLILKNLDCHNVQFTCPSTIWRPVAGFTTDLRLI